MLDTVILIPCILSFFLIPRAFVWTVKLNSNADTGHPCFIPRDILNDSDRYPLFFTFSEQPEYHVLINLIKFLPKLNFTKFYKYIHARQSRMLFRNQEIEVWCLICVCLHIKNYILYKSDILRDCSFFYICCLIMTN